MMFLRGAITLLFIDDRAIYVERSHTCIHFVSVGLDMKFGHILIFPINILPKNSKIPIDIFYRTFLSASYNGSYCIWV